MSKDMDSNTSSESSNLNSGNKNSNPSNAYVVTKPTSLICTRSTPFHRFLKTLLQNPESGKDVEFEIHPSDDQSVTFPPKKEQHDWKSSKTADGGVAWEGFVKYGDAVKGAINQNGELQVIELSSYDKYRLALLWSKTSLRPRTHKTLDAMVHDVERAMSRSKRNSNNDRARLMGAFGVDGPNNARNGSAVPRGSGGNNVQSAPMMPYGVVGSSQYGTMVPNVGTIPMHVNMPSDQFRMAVAEPITKPDGMQFMIPGVTEYPYQAIENATGYFSDTFKMSSGPFGVSYNVVLNGQRVIIKAIECEELLRTHVEYVYSAIQEVASLKHDHIVPLLGFCVRARCVFLVTEYQPYGSLTQRLFPEPGSQAVMLSWQDRLKIATGIAQGLGYLQLSSQMPTVHMDIKSSNILLTQSGEARIGDCGVSRLIPGPKQLAMAICTQQMHGRVDPEYLFKGALTVSSDIFSFGIIVLELISGQSAFVSVITPPDLLSQVQQVFKISRDQNEVLDRMQDKRIPTPWPREVLRGLLDLALQCASLRNVERPTISAVLNKLEEINKIGAEIK